MERPKKIKKNMGYSAGYSLAPRFNFATKPLGKPAPTNDVKPAKPGAVTDYIVTDCKSDKRDCWLESCNKCTKRSQGHIAWFKGNDPDNFRVLDRYKDFDLDDCFFSPFSCMGSQPLSFPEAARSTLGPHEAFRPAHRVQVPYSPPPVTPPLPTPFVPLALLPTVPPPPKRRLFSTSRSVATQRWFEETGAVWCPSINLWLRASCLDPVGYDPEDFKVRDRRMDTGSRPIPFNGPARRYGPRF